MTTLTTNRKLTFTVSRNALPVRRVLIAQMPALATTMSSRPSLCTPASMTLADLRGLAYVSACPDESGGSPPPTSCCVSARSAGVASG